MAVVNQESSFYVKNILLHIYVYKIYYTFMWGSGVRERKKDIFTSFKMLELKRAYCLSRAPRATYPRESKAHTNTLIRRTEAI